MQFDIYRTLFNNGARMIVADSTMSRYDYIEYLHENTLFRYYNFPGL